MSNESAYQAFANSVADAANENGLSAGEVSSLLGAYVRALVSQYTTQTGTPKREAELLALNAFMQGFGIPLVPLGEDGDAGDIDDESKPFTH